VLFGWQHLAGCGWLTKKRTRVQMSHAVVIGGSIAGLTAARALSESVDRVTILERDRLPSGVADRASVPHAKQPHLILPLGAQILETLFAGFRQELLDAGCPTFDEVKDIPTFGPQGWHARGDSDVELIAFRRSLLEHVIRERVRAIDNVTVVTGRATGLIGSDDQSRVVGVTLLAGEGAAQDSLIADLVVDASGRGSRSPKWLERLGYEPPREQHVCAYWGYASRLMRIDDDQLPGGLRGILTLPFPGHTKGGNFIPSDNGLYTCVAAGAMKDYPPASDAEFMAFLREAPSPLLAQIAELAEPVTEIITYRFRGNQRRLWEELARRPIGFIPIGDAVASLNPIYGQGMTVAVLEALKLRDRMFTLGGDLDALPAAFMEDLTASCEFPFSIAASTDANYPGATVTNMQLPQEDDEFSVLAEQVATEDPEVARDLLYATGWFEADLLTSPDLVNKVRDWVTNGRRVTNNDPACVREPVAMSARSSKVAV
jgi:2-polyprenyl-6-methoxyphenol hydroxylase-like FAD-dependent oxidoreductase